MGRFARTLRANSQASSHLVRGEPSTRGYSVEPSHSRQLSHDAFNRSHGSFELVLGPVLLALAGLWLDRRLGITPVLTIALAMAGLVGAVTKLYYTYRHEMAQAAEARGDGGRS